MKGLARAACTGVAMLTAFQAAGAAAAQQAAYPTKPIRLLVPFPPGGGTDLMARVVAQKTSEVFGQSVIVDNRPGAGGTIGAETAVRAAPDGYTLIMVSGSYATNAAVYKLAYDPIKDIQPIILVGESVFIVVVHPQVPVKTLKELIVLAKAKPAGLNYGSTGTGGITHFAAEYFDLMAGTRMTHVPYKGTGPALNALLGNQIHLMFGAMPAALPHAKGGRLRALAVTGPKRTEVAREVPTVGEIVPGYEVVLWWGVFGPKGLPKNVVPLWNQEINKALQSREMKERMAGEGLEPVGGAPEHFLKVIQRDVEKWRRVVKDAKLTIAS
jgi:tripartite-type tricarboxylate transporter receptor subunit TctC